MQEGDILQIRGVVREILDEKLNDFEGRINQHFRECRSFCVVKIKQVDESTQKAHERLDKHAQSIKCLDKFKNKIYGALGIVGIVLTMIGIKVW